MLGEQQIHRFLAECLRCGVSVERKLPGRTAKQLNPHPPDSLAWAAWIIARLGGWTGYASQKPPGPKTMAIGWRQLAAMISGYILAAPDLARNWQDV